MFTGNEISVNVPCSLIIPLIFEGVLIFEHDLDRFFLLKATVAILRTDAVALNTEFVFCFYLFVSYSL